ncbi:aminomethyltransferase family protein [Defluviimonas sp. WL0024]|uniref:Aminomethyltransferase family protein n=2 Tax=Albidovulum TaxID=205889 RepID=A0ABT3J4X9_9RHOB|nr:MULTISPECIES: aminomethyltransferase family protein [Defluviimonas]MCU9849147.1 aminomethyltransferase family protein [Defluviimonas sp. WL0024]MCW3782727.1 aminomethyltransferase family protein [Defluviimonas salinarum]
MKDLRHHYEAPLRTTPFHDRIAAANVLNQWGPWAGYTTALVLEDAEMEYSAIRNTASLYDLCPMIKYRIAGRDAVDYLNRLTLRDVARVAVGAVQYTAWCDDRGKLLDDGTLFRLGEAEFLLCCQERHLPWLLDSAIGFEVSVHDVTAEIAALSLQGPCTASVLDAAGFDVSALKPYRFASFPFDGGDLIISRTGFTGDLGYELWIEPALALPLWDRLMAAGAYCGIRPVGSHALDIARIEAGFLAAHADFVPADQALREDRVRSPYELALDWMIDFGKGHFNGRRALLAERDGQTSEWAFVALDIEGNVAADHAILYDGRNREVGQITSAAWSPSAKRSIALAQVRRPHHAGAKGGLRAEIYALRELHYVKLMMTARMTERPFFAPPRRRTTPPGRF